MNRSAQPSDWWGTRRELEPIVEVLKRQKQINIVIYANTSQPCFINENIHTWNGRASWVVVRGRANAIKALLEDMGINGDRIQTRDFQNSTNKSIQIIRSK